jgi:hypothetical protein
VGGMNVCKSTEFRVLLELYTDVYISVECIKVLCEWHARGQGRGDGLAMTRCHIR